jgi:hypothetical protein
MEDILFAVSWSVLHPVQKYKTLTYWIFLEGSLLANPRHKRIQEKNMFKSP